MQPIPDERHGGILRRTLPAEHEGVRTASCEKHDLNFGDIRRVVSAMSVDHLSRPNAGNLVGISGTAMQASGEATHTQPFGYPGKDLENEIFPDVRFKLHPRGSWVFPPSPRGSCAFAIL